MSALALGELRLKRWNTVAIVGVGLIGGSIGLALRRRNLAENVVGVGRRAVSLDMAHRVGAVTQSTQDLARGLAGADLAIICTPVAQIVELVQRVAAIGSDRTLITDVGSTKGWIVGQIDRLLAEGSLPAGTRYLGSHPIAGSEQSGVTHADADLFVGRAVVVTPTERTAETDVAAMCDFWSALGADVRRLSPEAHDRVLAATSHVPHVVAFALANSVPDDQWPLSAGGLRDTTRIAASDTELWAQILVSNRDAVLAALDGFGDSLSALREALRQGDDGQLRQLLHEAKRKRDAVGN
jgi:prephenate dehydrogenase